VLRRLLLISVGALALAAPAQAKPLLGITGDLPRFATLTDQVSNVHQAFLGWGQGLSYGSPFVSLFGTLTPVPMIHLGTGAKSPSRKEAISPAGIAAGHGDGYLIALNQAISQWGKAIYVRPMAEMNNAGNLWSGFKKDGTPKPGHSPADYRKAFARIYLIVHGGSASAINTKLKALGMPPISGDLASNPFPRLRVDWSPLAGGNPKIPANAAAKYYPGAAYVDVDGGDIFDETGDANAPWPDLEKFYAAALVHHRPFSVPEWGLFGIDDDVFVKHMCRFLMTHPVNEEAGFFESRPGSIFDIAPKPKSKKAYKDCITPYGGELPGWATATAAPAGVTSGARVTFTIAGRPVVGGPASAPTGADGLDVNMLPATGVITSAFWTHGGHSLGPLTVPAGATGLVFQTGGAAPPAPLTRPADATDFHVTWSAGGTITTARWTRVGTLLATIPVSAGQTSIAFTQGS
jgi:hypothetical protein